MSELDTLADELRLMANKLRRVLLNNGVCRMEALETLYLSMGAMREAADTIESLRDRLQEEGDALRDYRASQIAVEAERRLQEVGGQACHATQPNYEHCKYSTNRGWRDTSRYSELFGTPERAARTLADNCHRDGCIACAAMGFDCGGGDYDALLGWFKGDA